MGSIDAARTRPRAAPALGAATAAAVAVIGLTAPAVHATPSARGISEVQVASPASTTSRLARQNPTAGYPHDRYARAATLTTATGPAPVRGLAPFDHGGYVSVDWHNPRTASLSGVVVRYARGRTAPAGPHDGRAVPVSARTAHSARLPHLADNTKYAVSVWSRDAQHRYSTAATTTFTTRAATDPSATISGTVTDRQGHALAGVRVGAVDLDTWQSGTATSGGDGRYSIVVPPGHYAINFYGPSATGGSADATGYMPRWKRGSVSAHHTAVVDAQLAAGAAVTGRVIDPAGHGLAGVVPVVGTPTPYVEVDTNAMFGFYYSLALGQAVTAPDGTFTAKGLPRTGGQLCFDTTSEPVIGGDAAAYEQRCISRLVVLAPRRIASSPDVVLRPDSAGTISGTVTDSTGEPVGDVLVEANAVRGDGYNGDYSESDGSYRITGLPAGRYRLCGDPLSVDYAPGEIGDTQTCRAGSVRVRAGQDAAGADFRLDAAGALAGAVEGPDGKPLADVRVIVSRPRSFFYAQTAATDRHGQYLVKGLTAGRYSVCFDTSDAAAPPPGARSACSRVHVGVRTGMTRLGADDRLELGAAITGRFTDDAGQPVADVEVYVFSPNPHASPVGGYATTNPQGRYRMTGLGPGSYYVCFDYFVEGARGDNGCLEDYGEPLRVRAGQIVRHIDRVLARGGAIELTVQDEQGNPIVGVDALAVARCRSGDYCHRLPLLGKNGTNAASVMTDTTGGVTLGGLTRGDYAICLFAYEGAAAVEDSPTGYVDSCGSGTFDVTIRGRETVRATRTLRPAGAVGGRITDRDGNPVVGARVTVSGSGASDYADVSDEFGVPTSLAEPAADTITGPDGSYAIHGVAPGTQTVCVDATGAMSRTGYLDQCVGGPPGKHRGGTGVVVAAEQITGNVDVALSAAAAISGTVSDVLGHAVNTAEVGVFTRDGGLATVVEANSAGRYLARGLKPGTYVVCFQALRAKAQCYDRVPWNSGRLPAAATPVAATAGVITTGVDAVLRW